MKNIPKTKEINTILMSVQEEPGASNAGRDGHDTRDSSSITIPRKILYTQYHIQYHRGKVDKEIKLHRNIFNKIKNKTNNNIIYNNIFKLLG